MIFMAEYGRILFLVRPPTVKRKLNPKTHNLEAIIEYLFFGAFWFLRCSTFHSSGMARLFSNIWPFTTRNTVNSGSKPLVTINLSQISHVLRQFL